MLYFKSTYNRVKRRSGANPSYFRWKLTAPAAAANFLPGSTYDLVDARNGTVDLESVLYIRESESTSSPAASSASSSTAPANSPSTSATPATARSTRGSTSSSPV